MRHVVVLFALVALAVGCSTPQGSDNGSGKGSGIERLYVLDCGINQGKDQARWSPGVNGGGCCTTAPP